MALPAFAEDGRTHVDIRLRVTPKASRDGIDGAEQRADGQVRLKVRVRAVPEKGAANKAVIAVLAKALGLPKSAFELVSGDTARDKTLRVARHEGLAEALSRLGE